MMREKVATNMLKTLFTVLALLRLTNGLQRPALTGGQQWKTTGRPGLPNGQQRGTTRQPQLPVRFDEEQPFCHRESLPSAVNDFGFALSRRLSAGDTGNVFFSPLSLFGSLSMTYLGAAGLTSRQLERVLGFREHNLQTHEVHTHFRRLLSGLSFVSKDYNLLVANGLFLQNGYKVDRSYLAKLQANYYAVVGYVDFANFETVKLLNEWVANETRNAISKLFEGPMNPMTRLALLNAVYFKGTWKVQFPRNSTYPGSFFRSDGTTKAVNFMLLQDEEFRFFEDETLGYKFLELPYKGDSMAMFLVLPRRSDAPLDLKMTTDILCRVNASMRSAEMREVVLPRFKLEYAVQLKNPIASMGAEDLFKPRVADLSGIRPQKDLHVNSIMHKAVLEVTEEGSEAAAASGVVMTKYSLQSKPSFVANHPFLLYVIDRNNGLILFSGKVANP